MSVEEFRDLKRVWECVDEDVLVVVGVGGGVESRCC